MNGVIVNSDVGIHYIGSENKDKLISIPLQQCRAHNKQQHSTTQTSTNEYFMIPGINPSLCQYKSHDSTQFTPSNHHHDALHGPMVQTGKNICLLDSQIVFSTIEKNVPKTNKHFEPVLVCCGFFLTVMCCKEAVR